MAEPAKRCQPNSSNFLEYGGRRTHKSASRPPSRHSVEPPRARHSSPGSGRRPFQRGSRRRRRTPHEPHSVTTPAASRTRRGRLAAQSSVLPQTRQRGDKAEDLYVVGLTPMRIQLPATRVTMAAFSILSRRTLTSGKCTSASARDVGTPSAATASAPRYSRMEERRTASPSAKRE